MYILILFRTSYHAPDEKEDNIKIIKTIEGY